MTVRPNDKQAFGALLKRTFLTYGKVAPTPEILEVWWEALTPHSAESVAQALASHIAESKFAPVPADVITRLAGTGDGRPGPDEAWSIAILARDERATVVWTTETFEAFQAARAVLDLGDEVGARMAFKDAYNRLVTAARAARRPAAWQASLGWDAEFRTKALTAAANAGLLPVSMVEGLLPAPLDKNDSYDVDKAKANLEKIRKQLAEMPSALERAAAKREAERVAEVARLQEAKINTQERVIEYGQVAE